MSEIIEILETGSLETLQSFASELRRKAEQAKTFSEARGVMATAEAFQKELARMGVELEAQNLFGQARCEGASTIGRMWQENGKHEPGPGSFNALNDLVLVEDTGLTRGTLHRYTKFHGLGSEGRQVFYDTVIEVTFAALYDYVNGRETIANIKSSDKQDWMTPAHYVEAARQVMGSIDLDPATSEQANKRIRAVQIFTEEDDGLSQPWTGNVWLNPPYGGQQGLFSEKLRLEYEESRVSEAVLLVNAAATDTEWFQPLWDYLLCFTHHRISFVASNGCPVKGNTSGSVFVYFGPKKDKFLEIFSEFGAVVARYHGG